MRVKVNPNHIHHFKVNILDAAGNPTGEIKDVLQQDVQFPEYPNLPTYGLTVDFPIDRRKVLDAIKAKAIEVKAQVDRDEAIRSLLGAKILEFDIEV